MNSIIRFCLENKLVVFLMMTFVIVWGVLVAPFDWDIKSLPRSPIAVDAIPDIGENQQIVFTKWPGRSPKDIEDQITYPLTVSLLGIPGVKTIRSFSYFGYSSIYIIFKEDIEFYWSRSRILEKLSSLPQGTLPESITPALGPDATALGQIFWYTIEGRDKDGNTTGGWDLDEIRSAQDWYIRYALQSADGVSEVASVGGFVKEYQIDVSPDALRAFNISLAQVINAIRKSNVDVGARTIEVNKVEYVVRGVGFIKSLKDIEEVAVSVRGNNVPIQIKHIAKVGFGPALRRGALDKGGAEVVGGVVVARYGENPLQTIRNVKEKIEEIIPGMPAKILEDGTESKLTIVPFYDRSGLIFETLGTLNDSLYQEILVTIIVIIVMVMHFASSILISALLPLAILIAFILMKLFGVDANIVALSGIAIAIGTMVDMGIVMCENILVRLKEAPEGESKLETIFQASIEVSGAIITAVLTTVVSFLPVFSLEAAEGKLFKPLAYTKTFSLAGALFVALLLIPPLAHVLFRDWSKNRNLLRILFVAEIFLGFALIASFPFPAIILITIGLYGILNKLLLEKIPAVAAYQDWIIPGLAIILITFLLAKSWLPLGVDSGIIANFFVVGLFISLALVGFHSFQGVYPKLLSWALDHKMVFAILPFSVVLAGALIWSKSGEEFMPSLDEGSFLYMPTTMPHASIGESLDVLKRLDMAISAIPEVEMSVGKLGRIDSSLDPAPVSMFENIVNYKSEYILDKAGRPEYFRFNDDKDVFEKDESGNLIKDSNGRPFRQWRDSINSPDDIWNEIIKVAKLPGVTSSPKLQPIAARIVMLQSGMRAPMGIKIKGPTLEDINDVGMQIEKFLKEVPEVEASAVIADRVVGKPYLEIEIDRSKIARFGLTIADVQDIIEVAIGGKPLSTTVEGRERYPVRIRYPRELRSDLESLGNILVPTPQGQHLPLKQLAKIIFSREAQVIKSEDTFLTSYVVFDKKDGFSEVEVVNAAKEYLNTKIKAGDIKIPEGVSFNFAGSYENQLRAKKRFALVIPLTLFAIFMILYLQFRSTIITFIIFSGILVAWSGGFILLWLYSQDWFLNFSLLGLDFRELFQIRTFNLSVAVWVGFIALFGIASDDGVLMATYIKQKFKDLAPKTKEEIRQAVVEAAERRIRPALMTTATTVLALLPVLTSKGRGSDIMVPMAIPSFGGMIIALLTVFIVPVCYSALIEISVLKQDGD